MNVITRNPIKYEKTSSADGLNKSSLVEDIKQFQDWLDANVKNWVWSKQQKTHVPLNKGIGYGNFGENTANAWNTYGTKYIEYLNANKMKVPQIVEPTSSQTPSNTPSQSQSTTSTTSATTSTPDAPKDEKKKMSLGVKVAIGLGILAVVGGVVIYFATRKK